MLVRTVARGFLGPETPAKPGRHSREVRDGTVKPACTQFRRTFPTGGPGFPQCWLVTEETDLDGGTASVFRRAQVGLL